MEGSPPEGLPVGTGLPSWVCAFGRLEVRVGRCRCVLAAGGRESPAAVAPVVRVTSDRPKAFRESKGALKEPVSLPHLLGT